MQLSLVKIFMGLFILIGGLLQAEVWNDYREWNDEWERRYGEFMRSSEVNRNMFVDKHSPYYGLRPDCADAAYAFRAIFASQYGLPFVIRNPSGTRSKCRRNFWGRRNCRRVRDRNASRLLSNRTTKFDRYHSQEKRLYKFIQYVSDQAGTISFNKYDSYPIKIDKVRGGDHFTYQIEARFGETIRHVYNIKKVNPNGTFDVIFSTQARADKGLPMLRRREREFVNPPHDIFGFKRFRRPENLLKPISSIPSYLDASTEQYHLVNRLGPKSFFKYVREKLATQLETPDLLINRLLRNACEEGRARVENVNQGLRAARDIRGRCMNYQEYDAYSTPARDSALKKTIESVKDGYNDIRKEGDLSELSPRSLRLVRAIFFNSAHERELLQFCPIHWKPGHSMSLRTLWRRLRQRQMSTHPNDSVDARWGEGFYRTRCRAYY